ncbi:MAG TPA: acyl-CoA dehydrogenase, partial [Rhodobiaceae bacterium]|nr:acyl-CoA dehydrogenase [Rhodobiaceae bacterium]
MDFRLSDDQQAIGEAVQRICAKYDDAYWLAHDRDGGFPEDFVRDIAGGG